MLLLEFAGVILLVWESQPQMLLSSLAPLTSNPLLFVNDHDVWLISHSHLIGLDLEVHLDHTLSFSITFGAVYHFDIGIDVVAT